MYVWMTWIMYDPWEAGQVTYALYNDRYAESVMHFKI